MIIVNLLAKFSELTIFHANTSVQSTVYAS